MGFRAWELRGTRAGAGEDLRGEDFREYETCFFCEEGIVPGLTGGCEVLGWVLGSCVWISGLGWKLGARNRGLAGGCGKSREQGPGQFCWLG